MRIAEKWHAWYAIHMKRTNLVLDEQLLEEAKRELGARTYSATVDMALAEAIRQKKIERLGKFFGTGFWEGDLAAMREDRLAARSAGRGKS